MNADQISEHYYGDFSHPTTQRCRQRIHWICQQAAGPRVLDVGCSQGIACILLGREGFECTGVDIEQAAVDRARQELAREEAGVQKKVRFLTADAARLPFEDNCYDTVLLCEILEHLTHPERILQEVRRVLKDGGKVVITVPHGLLTHPDHKRTFYHISLLETVQPFFRTTLIEALHSRQLVYCGAKDSSYDWATVPREPLLRSYLGWEKEVEDRCTAAELSLIESSGRLGGQITMLRAEIGRLEEEAKARQDAMQTKDQGLRELQAGAEEARGALAALRAAVKEGEAAHTQLRTELAAAQAALATLDREHALLRKENAGLRHELAAREAAWQQRLADGEARFQARLREREHQLQSLARDPEADWRRALATQRIRDAARACLPGAARVLVISRGDDDLLQLDGRQGWHFPQTAGGVYAGYHPATASEAIAHLQALQARGAEFLLIPATAFWWLEFYADFRRHLETQCRLRFYHEDTCAIFDLGVAPGQGQRPLALALRIAADQDQPPPAAQPPAAAPAAARLAPAVSAVSTAPPAGPRHKPPAAALTVGGILDEFTAACFRPECHLVTFRPDNWREVLERTPPDLLLVESAWQGNGGSWQYKIASFKKPMGEELAEVVSYCQQRQIPTVFWNKEDPSHFDRFIHRAPLFDCVFTSDADMIPRYRESLKHDRVFALPFAAQPRLHNPILAAARTRNVCFAGAYYAFDHDERRADIDLLLRPALKFGLHIYDRQQGVAGADAKAYQFPAVYQPAIRGRLEYDEMVKAYKRYKVFLNVNSVKNSPTMFSRRVFELLACGTPVVSAHARGIVEMLGSDLVQTTRSEEQTVAHLKRLLGDADYWAEISARGVREVLSRHTYAHRLAEICRATGLTAPGAALPRVEAVAAVADKEGLRRMTETLKRQTFPPSGLTVVPGKRLKARDLDPVRRALPGIPLRLAPMAAEAVARAARAVEAGWVWLLNLDDYYGGNFLKDAALATVYSDAQVIGKQTHFEVPRGRAKPALRQPGHDFRLGKSIAPGSVLAKAGALAAGQWAALASGRSVPMPGLRVLSIDRFNYVRHGGGLESKGAQHVLI